jgi:copper(I)-binding protein
MKYLEYTFAVLALCALGAATQAHEYVAGDIEIDHPWTRATPTGAQTAAGYATITNRGQEPDRLIGGKAAGAEAVEVHEMSMQDGVMRMRQLEKGLEIAPGETIKLKPGSYHLMMIGLKQPYQEGEAVKGSMTFEKAGTVDIEFVVEGMGETMHHGRDTMDHGSHETHE